MGAVQANNIIRTTNKGGGLKVVDNRRVPLRKDGMPKKTKPGQKAGQRNLVYPIKDKEKLMQMNHVLMKRIVTADTPRGQKIAARNLLLFTVGINIALRASDLLEMKYEWMYREDRSFRTTKSIVPIKTRKKRKFIEMKFNENVENVMTWYVSNYNPDFKLDEYVFFSGQNDGEHLCRKTEETMIKELGKECGIDKNLGTHTLRQTFGYWYYTNAEDKANALNMLMLMFNHADQRTTLRYIGVEEENIWDIYDTVGKLYQGMTIEIV